MKNLLIVLSCFLCSNFLSAQTTKGNKLVGGDGNIGLELIDGSDNIFGLSLNPKFGVFVQDNLAVGGILGLNFRSLDGNSSTAFSLAPFGRYYLGEPDGYQFFADAQAGLYYEGFDNDAFGSDNITAFQFQLGAGVALFLTDSASLDFLLNFRRIGGDFDFSTLGVNIGFHIFLGGDE